MNWMSALVETYERCYDVTKLDENVPLLPEYHTLSNAQITITVDGDGKFVKAELVPKDRQNTIVQCTEESASRTSGAAPHGLSDKLPYLVKGISVHCEKPKRTYDDAFALYIDQLRQWHESQYSNSKVDAVYAYLCGNTIYDDLVRAGILVQDDNGILVPKKGGDSPLFAYSGVNEQPDAFVRWSVYTGVKHPDAWDDAEVIGSWIDFAKSKESETGLCYITGQQTVLSQNHPRRIRNAGDGAKIISSNDTTEFTFRGMFENASQAYGIGSETTQKAHNALRWLISKQGYSYHTLSVVAWSADNADLMNPISDPYEIIAVPEDRRYTNSEAAKHIRNMIAGYNSKISDSKVYILALDSSVENKGRISIAMFRDTSGADYIERLEKWHEGCAWRHTYAKSEDKQRITFVGAPSPKDIANAAYGTKADDKVKTSTIGRILPCIIDGYQIPTDIVDTVVRRASNPIAMETWEWRKTLSIACSLYKKLKGGKYDMTLEEDRETRDYLYGRLIAVADLMEKAALRAAGETRQTTAIRLMQRFSEFPYSTWRDIELALIPYAARLGSVANYYQRLISEIMAKFKGDDFRNNSKLSGEFLLAYHCQIEKHYEGKDKTEEEE